MPKLVPNYIIHKMVAEALAEDFSNTTDWTGNLIAENKISSATIITREEMIVCGQEWFNLCYKMLDPAINIEWLVKEGAKLSPNQTLCKLTGKARVLLGAERSSLNFLQTLSATATITHQYVLAKGNNNTQIMDTRKTIPGLRLAQKYAVLVGGGKNQRIGLFDGVLIKENHIIAHGGIAKVLQYAFQVTPKHIPIQIEVENLTELKEAISNQAKLILLDNFNLSEIETAITYAKKAGVILEVSGNVNLNSVADYAKLGVDRISIGSLTKNIQAIDLSMRLQKNT